MYQVMVMRQDKTGHSSTPFGVKKPRSSERSLLISLGDVSGLLQTDYTLNSLGFHPIPYLTRKKRVNTNTGFLNSNPFIFTPYLIASYHRKKEDHIKLQRNQRKQYFHGVRIHKPPIFGHVNCVCIEIVPKYRRPNLTISNQQDLHFNSSNKMWWSCLCIVSTLYRL